jgi:hypothetical protein
LPTTDEAAAVEAACTVPGYLRKDGHTEVEGGAPLVAVKVFWTFSQAPPALAPM